MNKFVQVEIFDLFFLKLIVHLWLISSPSFFLSTRIGIFSVYDRRSSSEPLNLPSPRTYCNLAAGLGIQPVYRSRPVLKTYHFLFKPFAYVSPTITVFLRSRVPGSENWRRNGMTGQGKQSPKKVKLKWSIVHGTLHSTE